MATTPSAQISSTGIAVPPFNDFLSYLQTQYKGIYGQDVDLDPDTIDGAWLSIVALALSDCAQSCGSVYNAFSPATAQGVGLSSVVKINGLQRQTASNSQADVVVIGQAGTILTNALAQDTAGYQWALPASVTIPVGGSIVVTVTCTTQGAITAAANTINKIFTPVRGWQSITNPLAAVPGNPVEDDATLRVRQSVSTGLPALSVLDSLIGAVANLPGVLRYQGYDNDQGTPDANGIPGHSIAIVVQGGDAQQIAETINLKKTPGTGTYGTTSETVTDAKGVPNVINFFQLTDVPIEIAVTITAMPGYVATTGDSLRQALVDYINSLAIGADVRWNKLWAPANLDDSSLADTYDVTDIQVARVGDPLGTANVTILFNEAATAILDNVSLTVNT
jgi:uncharacterized phage protein gp47/JayE